MNKREEQIVKNSINNIFSNIKQYLDTCMINETYPNIDTLLSHIENLKTQIFGFVCALDCIDSLEHNTNPTVHVSNKENLAYKANNDSFAKNLESMDKTLNKQNDEINKLINYVESCNKLFEMLENPIKVAFSMDKYVDKTGENNRHFKGLTDDKLKELVSKGYSISDIIKYTNDPNTNCKPYTHPAIKKRLKQLGLVARDGRRGAKHAQ